MANQQLLFLPRPLPDSAFNRLFEPIRVKCALDTGRVLIDGTSFGYRSAKKYFGVPVFSPLPLPLPVPLPFLS